MKPPLPYVQRTRDKQGVPRYYYRRKGWPRTTLPSPLKDMKAFLAAYAAAEQRRAIERPDDGTLGSLITAYLKSQDYRGLKPKSKETYNTTIAFLRSRPSVAMQVANIRRKHIKDLRDEIAETHIGKANMVVKVLRLLLSFAVDREWIVQNPALETLRAIPVHLHCQWVFHHGGEPYRNVASRFRQLVLSAQKSAQEAGRQFRPFRFHDLRHLFAVEYLKGGGSLYALQKIMGHSSVKVTEMYLDYLTPQEADKARMTG